MNELQLLRDYVTTMEKQIQSKNSQLRTLREQNQKLARQNQQLSMKKSYVLTNSICQECPQAKAQLSQMQSLCNTLQLKYDELERQKAPSNSVRVLSTSCTQCSRVKREKQELRIRCEQLQKNQNSRISASTRVYSMASCVECPKLKAQIRNKDETILGLRAQISNYNAKILALEGQIIALKATSVNPIIHTQPISKSNQFQRINYLNGQVEQYMALVNSLRSEIKFLNEQINRYSYRIRELQERPRQVQIIQKELSPEVREEIRALKIQVGELSNDNIVLRRENAQLRREIMNLQKTTHFIVERPVSPINQERPGRHFRKSTLGRKNYESSVNLDKVPYPQKVQYDSLQRKINLLQLENQYLRGTFYSEI